MASETIVVSIGGQAFTKWFRIQIVAGADQAARSASLQYAEPTSELTGPNFTFLPGTEVEITASGDQIFTGIVDDYTPSFDGTSHSATITARSKAKDLIDSSAVHKTGEFLNKDLGQIANELSQDFDGVSINVKMPLKKIPVHRLSPGSTVFNEIETLARQAGALLIGEPDSSITVTQAGMNGAHAGAIQQGVNMLTGRATFSEKRQHSKVHARGQKAHGTGKDNLRLEHVATNENIKRNRPLVIIAEGDTDDDRLKERAETQVQRAVGWSTTAEIDMHSWRDANGALWDCKKLVYVKSEWLKLDQQMAIKNVTFIQVNNGGSNGGTTCHLSLVDPQALGGKDVKGKSSDAWDASDGSE